jgi:hypothetical protein
MAVHARALVTLRACLVVATLAVNLAQSTNN